MRAARFAEAAEQHRIASMKKNKQRRDLLAQLAEYGGKSLQRFALAYIHHQRRPGDVLAVADQLGELRNQVHREIVYAVKSQVFKRPKHRRLSRTAHSRNDDDIGLK